MMRSEIIVLLNFIYFGIKRQISEYKSKWEKGEATELHARVPVSIPFPCLWYMTQGVYKVDTNSLDDRSSWYRS